MLGHVVTLLKGTVLSHPHSREAARKGEVIEKVKLAKGGMSRSKLENTHTLVAHRKKRS